MKNNPSIDHMISARSARLHLTKFLLPVLLCFSVAAARGAGAEKADLDKLFPDRPVMLGGH